MVQGREAQAALAIRQSSPLAMDERQRHGWERKAIRFAGQ